MPKTSAGLLLYRRRPAAAGSEDRLEVLLVHPGGPYWARRDEGAWSIPKGEIAEGEDPLTAARREFEEELGPVPPGDVVRLDPVQQRGGKVVVAWAVAADFDPSTRHSNAFTMEWPRSSGRRVEFPEIDRAEWFAFEVARRKILEGQVPLLDQLARHAGSTRGTSPPLE